ncbi:MAG TPA: hypothetical protein PLR06_13920 [Cyclobacteriaceae bacterium]|nr:hypothetical protein [Cyclobacteriaceae bacterium]
MMKKFLILVSLFFARSIQGQDLVVTVKNDTLRGTARILSYDFIDRIEIQANAEKKKTSLTAVQVRAVVIKQEVFNPVKTDKGYKMMKLVEGGYVSKYLARSSSNSFDTDYLVLNNGQATEIPNISFKRIMEEFLKDCSSIKKIIETNDYKRKDLDEILKQYNQCIENQTHNIQPQASVVSNQDPLVVTLSELENKISKDNELPSRKDALDVVQDISTKVKNGQKVPNYLIEGLKDFLKDSPAYQSDLENLTALLKK